MVEINAKNTKPMVIIKWNETIESFTMVDTNARNIKPVVVIKLGINLWIEKKIKPVQFSKHLVKLRMGVSSPKCFWAFKK